MTQYVWSSLLLFGGLGLGLVVLALAFWTYGREKKLGDLGVGTVALLYVVLVLRSLLQQSSGIACSMVSVQGLAAYGVGAAVLMGLALLYWRELGHREERQDDR